MQRAALPLLLAAGMVLFGGLGIWQLERRVWKRELIEQVAQRVRAPVMAAPGPREWLGVNRKDNEYRHVTVTGRFMHDRETPVLAVTELGRGYWVMTPLHTAAGYDVLINRGFVPSDKREPAARLAGQVSGTVTVTGLLRLSEPKGGFLRANDPAHEHWYSRDVAAIGKARGVALAPYFIDADGALNAGGWPVGGLTVIRFANNHLVYALTWFTLAGLCGYGVWQAGREHEAAG